MLQMQGDRGQLLSLQDTPAPGKVSSEGQRYVLDYKIKSKKKVARHIIIIYMIV